MIRMKDVLATEPIATKKKGCIITAQQTGNLLLLDCFRDRAYLGRYFMDVDSGKYGFWDALEEKRTEKKLLTAFVYNPYVTSYYWAGLEYNSNKDRDIVAAALDKDGRWNRPLAALGYKEEEYSQEKYQRKVQNRAERIRNLMALVPAMPDDMETWMFGLFGDRHFLFRDKEEDVWRCTSCGIVENADLRKQGYEKRPVHGEWIVCPGCGKNVQVKTRTVCQKQELRVMLLQDMVGGKDGVSRIIDVKLVWDFKGRRSRCSEAIRLILKRDDRMKAVKIYYNQYCKSAWHGDDWEERNPANRRYGPCFLYPGDIRAAVDGTVYNKWWRLFERMASDKVYADYNRMMMGYVNPGLAETMEYLYKGRFFRLCAETIDQIGWCSGRYSGCLDLGGKDINEVLGIEDTQKINRIRDVDGGYITLGWMHLSERSGKKLSQEMLEWAETERVDISRIGSALHYMSPQQIMNYIKRQQAESYPGMGAAEVLGQWQDYMTMCAGLKKDMDDEMVYRPRELKRRHQEVVEEVRKNQMLEQMQRDRERAEQTAKAMREKFPGAEEVLEEIRSKYEFEDEEYRIIVPKRLVDISAEGYALHHCAGASDRYFERIQQRETYICFLRRQSEPDVPYYTIEVEPGGTIRQHRSHYDEEPGIEDIRAFLKKWQRVIKKRLSEEDRRLAQISARKREDNIAELRAKNNTRVLQGLMEDFMEAENAV